jgi:AraC-like DNA-binding protein
MRRFRRAAEDNPDLPLYIPELCAAIGVSDRTLRACCREQLGMSPKRYLLLRRMHLARRALREAVRSPTTVTEIATQFGFWELGRFAVRYRSLFGESPSATLSGRSDRHRQLAVDHFRARFAEIAQPADPVCPQADLTARFAPDQAAYAR